MRGQFKITPEEKRALQLLVNGEKAFNLQGLVRARLYTRGWLSTDYKLSDTGRAVARQLGIKPTLEFIDGEVNS